MSIHTIGNPVPTPEEMARILGVSAERVAALRKIMDTPSGETTSGRRSARKKSSAPRKSRRIANKK
jgi:hypothetical protein